MLRGGQFALAMTAVLAVAGDARAQFGYGSYPGGYGGYGWGGWGNGGNTVQGGMARGLGYYAEGLGTLREDTAAANSINENTVQRWDQYMFLSQQQANRRAQKRQDARAKRDARSGDEAQKRLRENPTADDVSSGNALNAALDQINDPRIHTSSLRQARTRIPGKLIREIPFVNASEAVTISLDQLTAEGGWPAAFRDPKFDQERRAYSQAIDKALKEDDDGEISPQTLQDVRTALGRLRGKLEAERPRLADRARFGEAEDYLKTLYGMTKMLERPEVGKIIAELDSIKETSLGSLLGFMHTFNLRFGRSTTPTQRAAYESLYPLVSTHRDRVLKEFESDDKSTAKATDTPPPPPERPTDFFRGMHLDHLDGKRRVGESSNPSK